MGIYSTKSNRASNNGTSSCISSSYGSQVISTSSSNSWLIERDNSSIRVAYQLCVQVERSSITITSSISRVGRSSNSKRSSHSWASNSSNGSSSNNGGSSSIGCSLYSKVISTGSSNSWLIKGDNSSIRVGYQLSVKVEWSSISISSSIWECRGSNSHRGSSKRSSSKRGSSKDWSSTKLGSQVISTSSSYSRLINRSDGSIGMALESKETLGSRNRETGGKNQKLHCVIWCV